MVDRCCGPDESRNLEKLSKRIGASAKASHNWAQDDGRPMCEFPDGSFLMGADSSDSFPQDGEGPVREVSLTGFAIDLCAVSNDNFASFVEESGYITEAEHYGWSFVFAKDVSKNVFKRRLARTVPNLSWWYAVDRACWKRPEGPGSNIRKRGDHPVTHVTYNDVEAYCFWAEKRLPTEAEWEFAARGGLKQCTYAWGNELMPDGNHRCNIWQGKFPDRNTASDGFTGTCPVKTFPANGYGLFNTAGNVWEWCSDWFSADFHLTASRINPGGPTHGERRTMRGGSFLCHRSYCNRYRVAARTSNSPDSSTANLGFRCARSL